MELTYEIYRIIFIAGAILAGLMLGVSVFVFFLLRIPTVIGDLTGANARKAIENIRSLNENTGEKTYKSSQVNRERGKVTDKISASGRLIKNPSDGLHGAMATAKISTQRLTNQETTLLENDNQTTLLGHGNETTLLGNEGQTTLLGNEGQTTLLGDEGQTTLLGHESETTVLGTPTPGAYMETTLLCPDSQPVQAPQPRAAAQTDVFVLEYAITYVHTDEVIM